MRRMCRECYRVILTAVLIFGGAVSAFAGTVAVGATVEDHEPAVLRLRAGTFALDAAASLQRAGGAGRAAIASDGRFVIQLDGPLTPQRAADLVAAGVRLGAYLPNYAYIVRLPGGFDPVARLGGVAFVRWVGPF